jgi:hypothetical protein
MQNGEHMGEFKDPVTETEKSDTSSRTEKPAAPELSESEIVQFSKNVIEAITGKSTSAEGLSKRNFEEKIEQAIMEGVKGVPEALAERHGVGTGALNRRAEELLGEMGSETDPSKLSGLQTELIYQYITLISRVQNQADRAFTPALAKETEGMDCSLSAWSLKQKLEAAQVPKLKFEFAYPSDHAAGLITDALGRRLYVDAQNGFIAEVQTREVQDPKNPDTAYPIHEVISSKIIKGHIPGEGEVAVTRPGGEGYVPKYMGIRQGGALHTVGNLHMLGEPPSGEPNSPVYDTDVGRRFREGFRDYPADLKRFELLSGEIAGGKVIQETGFEVLSKQHHADFKRDKALEDVRGRLSEA